MAVMCAVCLHCTREMETYLREHIQYVKNADLGISSYRNGFPGISWKIRLLQFDWQKEFDMCQEIVKLMETLVNLVSITVCFPTPPQVIIDKHCLPTHTDQHLGSISHIVVLPPVTECVIDSFFLDLAQHIKHMELKFSNAKI